MGTARIETVRAFRKIPTAVAANALFTWYTQDPDRMLTISSKCIRHLAPACANIEQWQFGEAKSIDLHRIGILASTTRYRTASLWGRARYWRMISAGWHAELAAWQPE